MKSLGAAVAAIALIATPVRAACWNAEEASAANVRQFQSMLMVATLRCHAAGVDIAVHYNGFLNANKSALVQINERLKAHFIRSHGPVAGQRAYDGFTTSMANGYGAGGSSPALCENMAAIEREAGMMANSVEGLVMLAERESAVATMPDGRCDNAMTMAAATTARGVAAAAQAGGTPAIAARVGVSAAVRAIETPPAEEGSSAALAYSYIPGH